MPVADGATDGRDRIYRIPVGFAGSPKILKQIKLKNKWILNNKKNKKTENRKKILEKKQTLKKWRKLNMQKKRFASILYLNK